MFPTFISILDIQSWWEVPSIAHFCSLFRTAFNLLDFDIEDLEDALLTDGTEESSWLQELIVKLLSGCLPNNEISTFNYQMFLRRLFRQKCQEHDQYNPFNTDVDFQLLPLRTKVDILHALCDFRLDADDVLEQLKNLEADSLRVEPLGYDDNESAYWYFYGTRLYREDYKLKSKDKKENSVWQVICFTEEDWFHLAKKFKKSTSKAERQLYKTLTENFLPELPRLFKEKEKLARKRLLEKPRKSTRLQKLETVALEERAKAAELEKETQTKEDIDKKVALEKKRKEAYERRTKRRDQSEESRSEKSEERYEMAGAKARNKKSTKTRTQKSPTTSSSHDRKSEQKKATSSGSTTVGRQTNNSLASATGQIVIQQISNPHRKKLKTSQVFRQTDEDLQTGMHKILDYVKDHEDAWPFVDPVEEEYAPNYYSVIRKPMDLQKMEERLESGHYRNYSKFRADFQLIVDNCRLYNGVENEYTEMVDNLLKAFERATERYLDQISSSDDEIAVEFPDKESDPKTVDKKKKSDPCTKSSRRKPTLAAQTDKKRDRSLSGESAVTDSMSLEDNVETKSKNASTKTNKKDGKNIKASKKIEKQKNSSKKNTKAKKKTASENRKSKKDKSPVESSRRSNRSPSRDKWSSSPPPSWPPSSPDSRYSFEEKNQNNAYLSSEEEISSKFDKENKNSKSNDKWGNENKYSENRHKKNKNDTKHPIIQIEHKDKHNKLRETIEKLKAKSEISNKLKDKEYRNLDNFDVNTKTKNSCSKEHTEKRKVKEKPLLDDLDDGNSTADSSKTEKNSHKKASKQKSAVAKNAEIEALTLATEQTLKDINKWLDDTPRFSEFSSASNSPSHYTFIDEFDSLGNKNESDYRKKLDKNLSHKKDIGKDVKRRAFQRDPAKFVKRREIQRTIDRLQPGKSKGNLLSNVQNSKTDELYPLGPLSKIKDTKNSLIVKTDDATPKLSLGSVLDSFGKHKFIDDNKKEQDKSVEAEDDDVENKSTDNPDKTDELCTKQEDKNENKPLWGSLVERSSEQATPNLSAWFKAFGAPKTQQPQKKGDNKETVKTEETPKSLPDTKKEDAKKVPPPEPSPNLESPAPGQPTPRQRKISTGSSMSERSSFSQDMDSPRVGIDERLGAYPAPYPSPLHKSPSGASPVMASPRLDVSPKAPSYPTFNGQIRVGFYQDTVSTKSSPDKSSSPRDNPHSPYSQYSEHMYTPSTTTSIGYAYSNPPYYSQPNYSSTNPTPPYNNENLTQSLYDTNKPLTDQYQNKTVPNYSNESSPASQQHSPNVDLGTQKLEKAPQPNAVFPVKKRAYNEGESSGQMNRYEAHQDYINRTVEMGLMIGRHDMESNQDEPKQFSQQNIAEQKTESLPSAVDVYPKNNSSALPNVSREQNPDALQSSDYSVSYNKTYNTENAYPLNIPSARAVDRQEVERKIDMSKYTNMGYTGTDMTFARNSPQYTRSNMNYTRPVPTSNTDNQHSNVSQQAEMAMRYATSGNVPMSYKDMDVATSSTQDLVNITNVSAHQSSRTPSYGNPVLDVEQSLGLRGSLANLSHIMDRFSAEDRMLSSLQSGASSYYSDKKLSGAHMFSKGIVTSSSNLPIFSQPNMVMSYNHDMQATAYNRQIAELQNQSLVTNEKSTAQVQQDTKKSKRRKTTKTATSVNTSEVTNSTTTNQGFQSYAGIKNNAALEPSAISLKTTSVVPGSAFNFGPAPTGLGLSAGLYGDKEGYPNYLEDFRAAPNYYMAAAAAAHHRSAPESGEKTARTAHQSSTPQGSGYPFLGAPQPRPPGYPLGTPFMPAHQAQLMDPSSPLYQQYVLHQGLLGAPGPYPPGYHPALSMRQPYESMTRPSWL